MELSNNAGIAQMVEQLICNQKVPSSILGVGTIKNKELGKRDKLNGSFLSLN